VCKKGRRNGRLFAHHSLDISNSEANKVDRLQRGRTALNFIEN